MKNIYEILKEYLELKISNLRQDKSKDTLKLYDAIKLFLKTPRNQLNKLDDFIHEVICTEILKNDQSLIKNYQLLCVYSSYIDNPFLSSDSQIIEANKNYKIISDRLTNLLKTLEIQIYKLKMQNEESQALISIYENYLTLFNKEGIKKYLEIDELNAFFEFLKSSTLEKEVILNLITEFSKFNITYQINKQKLKTNSRIKEIDTRASEITKEIGEESSQTLELESPKEIPQEILTQQEKSILNKIKIIISELRGVTGDSSLLELLDGEFTINGRKEIYEAAGTDKWKLIYDDINQNLLPNLEKNKDSILAIFKYIIDTYTGKKEEQQMPQCLDIKYDDILSIEEVRIHKYLELSKKSRFIYATYDKDKQKLIDIAYGYLQKGDEVGLKSLKLDISLTDIVFMKNLEKLKSLVNDWQVLKEFTDEEILSYGIDEYRESIKETSDSIVSILNILDKDYEKKNSETILVPLEDIVVNCNDQENYVIFLNDNDGVPIAFNTILNAPMTDNLMDVYRSIINMNNVSYFELMKKYKTSVIKPDREPQMHKIRKGESRISFIQVPISSENRIKIGKDFRNKKRFNVILIVDIGFKHNDSKNQSVYNEFNRVYDRNINQIMHIFNLFGKDFDEKSFEEAQKILLNGIETVKEIEKIAQGREKKGV